MIEAAGQLRETLALVAPGTVLRDGLERILRGRTGAIIVLGFDPVVEAISSGGFHLDVELSAARLRELVEDAEEAGEHVSARGASGRAAASSGSGSAVPRRVAGMRRHTTAATTPTSAAIPKTGANPSPDSAIASPVGRQMSWLSPWN